MKGGRKGGMKGGREAGREEGRGTYSTINLPGTCGKKALCHEKTLS
jgi:hypothetical protein